MMAIRMRGATNCERDIFFRGNIKKEAAMATFLSLEKSTVIALFLP